MINVQETCFYLMKINFYYMLSSRKKNVKINCPLCQRLLRNNPRISPHRYTTMVQNTTTAGGYYKMSPLHMCFIFGFYSEWFSEKKHNEIVCCLVSKI